MNKKLLDALENCLQRMAHGEPLDEVMARYPDLAPQLQPLLETAMRLRSPDREHVSPAILVRQRVRGLALAADLRQRKNRNPLWRHSWRPALTVLAVIALLVMSSNGLLVASAHSIPGDTLYSLKRTVESTQLHLTANPAEREELEHTFEERRVDETRILLVDQRVENVDFTGPVSSQSENKWLVSGIPVILTPHTQINDDIVVGDNVEVLGATNASGGVEAARLTLVIIPPIQVNPPAVVPSPTPTLEPSGESGDHENSSESALSPSHSGEEGGRSGNNQNQAANNQNESSSGGSAGGNSSGEDAHHSQSSSEGRGD